jgi:hypothetical protein
VTIRTDFYVYEHIRPDTGQVFYVGKGFGKRAWKMSQRTTHHRRITAKLLRNGLCVQVELISQNLPEESAFTLEKMRIAMWRAAGVSLVNKSDGGEGPSGLKWSDESKQKFSKRKKGKKPSSAALEAAAKALIGNKRLLGHKHSDETKELISKSGIGRKHSAETIAKLKARVLTEEHKRKIGLAHKGKTLTNEQKELSRAAAIAQWRDPIFKAKMIALNTGRKRSQEAIEKQRRALIGRKHSPETIAKIKAAHLERARRNANASA